MIIAAISFPGTTFVWVALVAAVVLIPLAWIAVAPAGRRARTVAVGLGLRTLGIGLILVSLLDPQWTAPRAVRGANAFAVLADNSEGMTVRDPGSADTRGEELRQQLLAAEDGWMATLRDDFQVRPYVFDRSLQRVRGFARLDFRGDRSDLGKALASLRERFTSQPIAGALLFTDGNATDVDLASLDVKGLPPIYPVVVGKKGVRDIRIEGLGIRQTAFDDAPVDVRVDVSGTTAARDIAVSLAPLGDPAGNTPDALPAPARLTLNADGSTTSTSFNWHPSGAGIQFYQVEAKAGTGEELEEATSLNNRRLFMLDRGRAAYRILYVGGRPNWEFKFLNRALQADPQLQMVGLLRVAKREPKFDFRGRAGESSNPMYRGFGHEAEEAPRYDQPVLVRVNARDESELRGGFPKTAEELFAYDAVILDDVEAAFFSSEQLLLLRKFTADRGGGLLLLGGADTLDNGDYADTALAAALPVYLDRHQEAPPEGSLRWSLTREGWVEPWTRVRANEQDERARLQILPRLYVAHALDQLKPGATVLAKVEDSSGRSFPSLIEQRFGAGHVACLTIGDLWRWGLHETSDQQDLARFWRQVARWLVTDVPAQITLAAERDDTGGINLRATVCDRAFRPLDLARVQITIRREAAEAMAPDDADTGGFESVIMPAEPSSSAPGVFTVAFAGRDAGAYRATAEAIGDSGESIGRAETGWVVDPSADEFRRLDPDRRLLEVLAEKTGGKVIPAGDLERFVAALPDRGAPVEEMSSRPMWHSSWVLLAVLGCLGAEWFWRRWRGLA